MYYISKYICIQQGKMWLNGSLYAESHYTEFGDLMKDFYKKFQINYPKFYKMDDLCKLAFIGSELLLKDENSKQIALLFSNSEASLDTDIKHQQSIQNVDAYYPSPAIFVYTLPNIAIGEVSIRHQLQTESCFFVADKLPVTHWIPYTNYLLQNHKAEKVVCAWVHKLGNNYEAFLYLVEKKGEIEQTEQNINELFK